MEIIAMAMSARRKNPNEADSVLRLEVIKIGKCGIMQQSITSVVDRGYMISTNMLAL
jgi:hypothetical protein